MMISLFSHESSVKRAGQWCHRGHLGMLPEKNGEGLRERGRQSTADSTFQCSPLLSFSVLFSVWPASIRRAITSHPTSLEKNPLLPWRQRKHAATGKFGSGQWSQLWLLPGSKVAGQEGGRGWRWQRMLAVRARAYKNNTHTHTHTTDSSVMEWKCSFLTRTLWSNHGTHGTLWNTWWMGKLGEKQAQRSKKCMERNGFKIQLH